jgi:predicted transcriptional regulator
MKVILSIKPEFANKIFDGSKLYEFRRSIFKDPDVKIVVVYASSPVQKIIGEFEIDHILNLALENLWDITQDFSGITKDFFLEYFENKDAGYAIKIKKTKKYNKPLCIREDFNAVPPQSFLYLAS